MQSAEMCLVAGFRNEKKIFGDGKEGRAELFKLGVRREGLGSILSGEQSMHCRPACRPSGVESSN